ncbi:ImcF-related family protein [Pseudomonas sp. X10]
MNGKRIGSWIVLVCLLVVGGLLIWTDNPIVRVPHESGRLKYSAALLAMCLVLLSLDGLGVWVAQKLGMQELLSKIQAKWPDQAKGDTVLEVGLLHDSNVQLLHQYLRRDGRRLFRRRLHVYLVLGQPEQLQGIAPTLAGVRWQASENTLLLWGGSAQAADAVAISICKRLCRWRGLDGVVWALDQAQSADVRQMRAGAQGLQRLARELGWQLPVHLWQVCASQWPQSGRPEQAVGCQLPVRFDGMKLQACLEGLQHPLREAGLAQLQGNLAHDFLLRLSRDLQAGGTANSWQALEPLSRTLAREATLRGLWFSLPLSAVDSEPHDWPAQPAWDGILGGRHRASRRLGWSFPHAICVLLLTLAAVWGAGLLLSFISNRAQVLQMQSALAELKQVDSDISRHQALDFWAREVARVDHRVTQGAPWYQRFGLDQNPKLREAMWPHYVQASQQLLRDPALASLMRDLNELAKLPVNSPERPRRAKAGYDQLKAYLMLARPERVEPAFLVRQLGGDEPGLWQFYAEQLAINPDWHIEADARLVAQVRRVLLEQIGQRTVEANLYQQVLDASANQYPPLGLAQLVGETDAAALFTTDREVPGVFTRQAWEAQVRPAIDAVAEARRQEIDWVLSDQPDDIAVQLTPEQLRERLTERYFLDYGNAWLDFLNSLRWRRSDSLVGIIDQLTLVSDTRQSPLIALMNTLAYQGQAGHRGQALANSLLQSAQKLIGQDKVAAIEQPPVGASGPLDTVFAPLLALLGKGPETGSADDKLSLQAFLTRVTQVRLQLQQVSQAPDSREMAQSLAQTVFQGKAIDLTSTQAYGGLIAASLGAQWHGFAQALFVQPLEQAWQRVLQPSAAGLDNQWQRSIVQPWQEAFVGRYPFAVTGSDASLPMLGQMIRADTGRIEQFLIRELRGVLRKEGSRWVDDPRQGQGLRVDPHFLEAINQLSHLADVLYTDGGMGLAFELRAKPVRDLVQTRLTLNGEQHLYFNQQERWQRFSWPGRTDYPGINLTWSGLYSGERLLADYSGTWGLIRLLEQAQVTPLDDRDSHFRLVIEAPDGLALTWHLRTELGEGPLALLALRGFELPQRIFLEEGRQIYARNEVFE